MLPSAGTKPISPPGKEKVACPVASGVFIAFKFGVVEAVGAVGLLADKDSVLVGRLRTGVLPTGLAPGLSSFFMFAGRDPGARGLKLFPYV